MNGWLTERALIARDRMLRGVVEQLNSRQWDGDVDVFLNRFETSIAQFSLLVSLDDDSTRRAQLEGLLRISAEYRAAIGPGRFHWATPRPAAIEQADDESIARGIEANRQYARARIKALDAADEFHSEIERAAKTITSKRRGRRPADEVGLLASIARAYAESLGEHPTSTPGGVFSNIVALVLEYTHAKPTADVSRQVRAALKSLTK